MSLQDGKTDKLDMTELGVTGLKHSSGMIFEEELRELQGPLKFIKYTEMKDNDSTVGSVLFAIAMLIRNVEWTVTPPDSPDGEDKAEFLKSNMDDMDKPWTEVVSEITDSMLPFGLAPLEQVFKRRLGQQGLQFDKPARERVPSSRFNDGLIGWSKLPLRSPDTISRWKIAENGDIEGFWQRAAPNFEEIFIPSEKILLFRTTTHKNNPEGRSVLRNAFRAWFFKKRIENIEGVGIERDLAGLPVALVPPELLSKNASVEEKQTLAAIKQMVINIRRDEQEGIIFPMKFDRDGNEMFKLKLLTTGGTRQFKTDDTIKRYRSDIAMTLLADFILLGHEKVGSFSLSSSKTSVFTTALSAWLESIASIFNRCAIPLLFQLNGMDLENLPKLTFGDIETVDLNELSAYINVLTGAGIDLTGEKASEFLKQQGNIPLEV